MQLEITGQHFEITDAIRDYLRQKLVRIERHSKHLMRLHIVLTIEHDSHIAKANMHLPKSDLYVTAESKDMYATIDQLADEIDQQVIKYKDKWKD